MSALETLLENWDLASDSLPERERVRRLLDGMADVPYENLTKVLADGRVRSEERLARDYLNHGTGGTCFSLVSLFLTLAHRMNLDARAVLADRSYGTNTHCAAIVRTEGGRVLADPGFLIHRPVDLDGERVIELPHTKLRLDHDGAVYTVYPDGHEKFRYQLHDRTVSDDAFRDLWTGSFDWDMMNQLVINRVMDDTHLYLRDTYLHVNRREDHRQKELDAEQVVDQVERMGIDRSIARAAAAELNLFFPDTSC